MKKIFLVCLGIFLISLISGFSICIDHTPPSAPSNLILTALGNNIQLTWTAATDTPNCSGIDYYEIYRGINGANLNWIANTSKLSYLDKNLVEGNYIYMIHAWDLAGHNEGNGVSNSIILQTGGGDVGGGSSGSGGGSDTYWNCEWWGECVNETQSRICTDSSGKNNITETRTCIPDFTPLGYSNSGDEGLSDLKEISTAKSFLTGAVVGVTDFVKSGKGLVAIGFLSTLILVFVFVVYKKSKFTKKK